MRLGPDARVAIYYAPAGDDLVWIAGCTWLGRDPASGRRLKQPALPEIEAITADARLYGFHATLKPPMRLRPGTDWAALHEAASQVAATLAPFPMPSLAVTDLYGFLALCETDKDPSLQAFADAWVAGVDAFRAPPTEAELARRRANGLSPERDAMLQRWGYPDVFQTWRFHMTLTRRLTPPEAEIYRPAAEEFFAAALPVPRLVRDACLYVQPAPGEAFTLAARLALGTAAAAARTSIARSAPADTMPPEFSK
jgi:hypothetical protein